MQISWMPDVSLMCPRNSPCDAAAAAAALSALAARDRSGQRGSESELWREAAGRGRGRTTSAP